MVDDTLGAVVGVEWGRLGIGPPWPGGSLLVAVGGGEEARDGESGTDDTEDFEDFPRVVVGIVCADEESDAKPESCVVEEENKLGGAFTCSLNKNPRMEPIAIEQSTPPASNLVVGGRLLHHLWKVTNNGFTDSCRPKGMRPLYLSTTNTGIFNMISWPHIFKHTNNSYNIFSISRTKLRWLYLI
jgi:hypothetical protein